MKEGFVDFLHLFVHACHQFLVLVAAENTLKLLRSVFTRFVLAFFVVFSRCNPPCREGGKGGVGAESGGGGEVAQRNRTRAYITHYECMPESPISVRPRTELPRPAGVHETGAGGPAHEKGGSHRGPTLHTFSFTHKQSEGG